MINKITKLSNGERKTIFRKLILLIIYTHMQVLEEEKDDMFQDALKAIKSDINFFFLAHNLSNFEIELIKWSEKKKIMQNIFNGKQFHFIAFVLELIDRFINYGLNDNVKVFKRKSISRFKLYKVKLSIFEKKLPKDEYEKWKESEKEARQLAKKIWEKHKELLQIKLSRKDNK